MSSKMQTIYSIPIVDDEGFKFTLDQPADSLIAAVLLMHRWLNCQHLVDIEMLVLTERDKKKLSLQKEKELTEQKLRAIYKTQYAITDSPWPNHVCIQKMKPLREQERQLKAKISELEAEIWS
ncbi:hypothetical protein MJ749_13495 [Paenibacillus polymyxa]|uniref:hypothetical protein n=1 Tax=Paenibacillus polymyxa TaxID=1406 RepID=UPI001C9E0E0B|nr:hypothetical protein [Paenibacillus polymyxa]MBY7740100.1 hypothetical protein [Paenibacillus polymyxa]UMR33714.1 hypothetical protein MJ749_13495 [Paenibacillus polymyxa]